MCPDYWRTPVGVLAASTNELSYPFTWSALLDAGKQHADIIASVNNGIERAERAILPSNKTYFVISTNQAIEFKSLKVTWHASIPLAARFDNTLSVVHLADQKPSAVATKRDPMGVTTC